MKPERPQRKFSKKTHHVAVRAIAVREVARVFPHMTSAEIAIALGLTRHKVKHYLLGDIKSTQNRAPAWAGKFLEACNQLITGQCGRAAEPFAQLANLLHAEPIGGRRG